MKKNCIIKGFQPAWETDDTCFKTCDSTLGVWNDPPELKLKGVLKSPIHIRKGKIHLLDDSSISGISKFFPDWEKKKIACLYDERSPANRQFRGEYLFPRYLFEAGIISQRIFPSPATGFVDENNLFFWPVSTTNFDVILWVKSANEISSVMRALHIRHSFRHLLECGGELYLGGEARNYLPYLLDNSEIKNVWTGLQNVVVQGSGTSKYKPGILSDNFLRIEAADSQGRPLSQLDCSAEHYPYGYSNKIRYENGIVVESKICFAEHDCIALDLDIENTSKVKQNITLAFSGEFKKSVRCKTAEGIIIADLEEQIKYPASLIIASSAQTNGNWHASGCKYSYGPVQLPLAPGESLNETLSISLVFGQALETNKPGYFRSICRTCNYWEKAREKWRKKICGMPAIPEKTSIKQYMLERAVTVISANTWRPPEEFSTGILGKSRVLTVQRHIYPNWYAYENGFYAVGLRNIDVALAREQISLIAQLRNDEGFIPIHIHNYPPEIPCLSCIMTQIPVLAFAAWQTYAAEPKIEFIEKLYEPLSRNIDWWYANRQLRQDGTFGFIHGQEGGGDDTPRADEPSGALRAGMKNMISPDACGFVLMEMQCLARMANVLGRTAETARWQTMIKQLSQKIIEICYDAETNMFRDVDIAANKFYRGGVTPWHFVPLWAGMSSVDMNLARKIIKEQLVDKLLGPVPFPVISRDDKSYLSDVYWRGPSWPQTWEIMLQTLWWYGFKTEADSAANQLVDICAANPYIMEYYDSRSGQGLSLPEYSFAATALLEIIFRRYQDPPPWDLNTY